MAQKHNSVIRYNDEIEARIRHAEKIKPNYSHIFKKKSLLDLILLSAAMLGIEFAYAAETAFITPILLSIGVDHGQMTMAWAVSPIMGFFLTPILGMMSDRCRLQLGRRRPLILLLSVSLVMGIVLVMSGNDLASLIAVKDDQSAISSTDTTTEELVMLNRELLVKSGLWQQWSTIFTIIGMALMDFSADACLSPIRTYLLDVSIAGDHPRALSICTVMAGLGGCLGYILSMVNWETLSIGQSLGGNIKTVFTIMLLSYCLSLLLTITSFREVPLPLIETDALLRPVKQLPISPDTESNKGKVISSIAILRKGRNICDRQNYPENCKATSEISSFLSYLKAIVFMPYRMWILCVTNLFCWATHLCYALYFTAFVGEAVFGGVADHPANSETRQTYDAGVRFGCLGMAVYAMSCAIYSFLIQFIFKRIKIKYIYIGGIIIDALSMALLAAVRNKIAVVVCSITAGFMYSTLSTIPYILVAQYHSASMFHQSANKNNQDKHMQVRGLGTDMAIMTSMLFIAQFFLSLCAGPLIVLFGTITSVIYAASIFGVIAAMLALLVVY